MYKKLILAAVAAGAFAIAGCSSDGASGGAEGGADVFGAPIYLRGEMNDWNAQPQYLPRISAQDMRQRSQVIIGLGDRHKTVSTRPYPRQYRLPCRWKHISSRQASPPL